jgi:hypothetical protein
MITKPSRIVIKTQRFDTPVWCLLKYPRDGYLRRLRGFLNTQGMTSPAKKMQKFTISELCYLEVHSHSSVSKLFRGTQLILKCNDIIVAGQKHQHSTWKEIPTASQKHCNGAIFYINHTSVS